MAEDTSTQHIEELISRIEQRDKRSRRMAVVTTVLPALFGLGFLYFSVVEVRSSYREAERQRRDALQAAAAAKNALSTLHEVELQKRQHETTIITLQKQIAEQTDALEKLNTRVGGASKTTPNHSRRHDCVCQHDEPARSAREHRRGQQVQRRAISD